LRGADIAFASDLPPAAGLSSSSALVIATFLAISDLNALGAHDEYRRAIPDADHLAGYLGAVEGGAPFGSLDGDRGVGTFSGSQDHTAILCSRAPSAIRIFSIRRELARSASKTGSIPKIKFLAFSVFGFRFLVSGFRLPVTPTVR